MTETVDESLIFGRIPDSSDNLYRLKNIGKTRESFFSSYFLKYNFWFVYLLQHNIKDDASSVSLSENEKSSAKNGIVGGKTIVNGNSIPNGQMHYQNGIKKSDVAVIDIIEDGK